MSYQLFYFCGLTGLSEMVLSPVGASRWGMGLLESWWEVRAGSGSEMIVSLQMYSKGQNSHTSLQTQGKGGSNSTFDERSKQMSGVYPRWAPVEGVGGCKGNCKAKLKHRRALFSEGFALAIMGPLVSFLVSDPQILQGNLFISMFVDWKFTFGPSV